jgi:CAAX prenyl protease-like protein
MEGMSGFSIGRAGWARVLPFLAFMALLALRGLAPDDGSWGFDTRWLYAVKAAIVGALLAALWRQYAELSRRRWPDARELLLAVAAGLLVFVLWIRLDAPWMTVGLPAASFVPLGAAGQIDWSLVAIRIAGATLVVPLMEELFWRSFLMRWIQSPVFEGVDPARVGLRAVLLSTFVFTLAHTLWLAAAIAGIVYAWLYIRTRKLWVAVISHAVTNLALGIWVVRTGQWPLW